MKTDMALSLGAVVLQPASEILARKRLSEMKRDEEGLASLMAGLHLRIFAVILPLPATPKAEARGTVHLAELACGFLKACGAGPSSLKITLGRDGQDHDGVLRAILKTRDDPVRERSRTLQVIDPMGISFVDDEPLLELSQLAAVAVQELSPGMNDRLMPILCKRFGADETGGVLGHGLEVAAPLAPDEAARQRLRWLRADPRPARARI